MHIEATRKAQAKFETFATLDAPHLPTDPVDAMQVLLGRWQVDRFGLQSDERMALGVVEELGECWDSPDVHEAIDALGDICVYAGQLLMGNRLAIGPVLGLAHVHENTCSSIADAYVYAGSAIVMAGEFTHAVLKHTQRIRGLAEHTVYQVRLVDKLARCISSAISRVKSYGIEANAAQIYQTIGTKVLQRKQGDVMIPNAAESSSAT